MKSKLKKLVVFSSLFSVLSCGVADKVGDAVGQSISKGLTTKEKDPEANKVVTRFILEKPISCVLKVAIVEVPIILVESILRSALNKNFDLVIPESLSQRIVDDIRTKAHEDKIHPNNFWIVLDPKLKEELNTYLVNLDIKKSDTSFNDLIQEIGYAFSYIVETGELQQGLSLRFKDGSLLKRRSFAFSEKTREKIELGTCDEIDVSEVIIPEDIIRPSNITTRAKCANEDEEALYIEGLNDEVLSFNIEGKGISEKVDILREDFILEKDKRKYRLFTYTDSEVGTIEMKIFKTSEFDFENKQRYFQEESMDEIDLKVLPVDGKKVKMKDLECKVEKTLRNL